MREVEEQHWRALWVSHRGQHGSAAEAAGRERGLGRGLAAVRRGMRERVRVQAFRTGGGGSP